MLLLPHVERLRERELQLLRTAGVLVLVFLGCSRGLSVRWALLHSTRTVLVLFCELACHVETPSYDVLKLQHTTRIAPHSSANFSTRICLFHLWMLRRCGHTPSLYFAILFLLFLLVVTRSFPNDGSIMSEALSHGKADLEEWLHHGKPKRKHLCATFVSTNQTAFQTTIANARTLKCNWAVIFYQISNMTLKNSLCSQLSTVAKVIHCEGAMVLYNTSAYQSLHLTPSQIQDYSALQRFRMKPNVAVLPKQTMYLDLLPFLPRYHKVLLLDSDMQFSYFDFPLAMQIWQCSFRNPPLIVHAGVVGKTLCLEAKSRWWKRNNNWTTDSEAFLFAVQVPFIEQQAPFIHAGFFNWLLKSVVRRHTLLYHLAEENDFGTDVIWCKAALAFGSYVLGYKDYTVSCALLNGAGPVYHKTTKTINKSKEFVLSGSKILRTYKELFPEWYQVLICSILLSS